MTYFHLLKDSMYQQRHLVKKTTTITTIRICGLLFRDTVLFFSLSHSGQGYMLEGGIVEPDGSELTKITFLRTPW